MQHVKLHNAEHPIHGDRQVRKNKVLATFYIKNVAIHMKKVELNTSKLQLQKEKITDLVSLKIKKDNSAECSTIPTTRTQPFSVCQACL